MAQKNKPRKRKHPLKPWYAPRAIDQIIRGIGALPRGRVQVTLPDLDAGGWSSRSLARRQALIILLNQAADAWHFQSNRRIGQPSQAVLKALHTVEVAANNLVNVLGPNEEGDAKANKLRDTVCFQLSHAAEQLAQELGPYPEAHSFTWRLPGEAEGITFYGGEEQVHADIETVVPGLRRLAAWAKGANSRIRSRGVPPGAAGRPRDEATEMLFRRLLFIWSHVLGKRVVTSVSPTGVPSGPLIRFIQVCLEPLGVKLTPEAIRGRIRPLAQEAKNRTIRT